MENIKRKESRENWICRYWLQIESCRKCLFDALCSYQDQQNANKTADRVEAWMDNEKDRAIREKTISD